MTDRPAIPAEIERQILIESGHRCAVCGDGCPLERAHIIPWHKSKEHKAEDLICLCASCHERADLEGWGAKTLREYKKKPWIVRKFAEKLAPVRKGRVELTIDMDYSTFDESHIRLLQYALAGFLDISPDAVRIVSATESNSVKVTIEIPNEHIRKLLSAFKSNDSELLSYLGPFNPIDLRRGKWILSVKTSASQRAKYARYLETLLKRKAIAKRPEGSLKMVSAQEAAKILGVNQLTLQAWSRRGWLHGIGRGRSQYFSVSQVLAFKKELETRDKKKLKRNKQIDQSRAK